jgi:hypothetical protein
MINIFLQAKHWQLFLLTFGIPIILQFITIGNMFTNFDSNKNFDSNYMFNYLILYQILILILMGVFFGWFWSVAIGLQRIIPVEIKLNTNRFKMFLLFLLFYIIFFVVFFISTIASSRPNPMIIVIIMPFHLFSMFCIVYCLYFVAKTFKTAELQQKVTFKDFAGEFFMIWFYPVGIWIIQPKINQLFNDKNRIDLTTSEIV